MISLSERRCSVSVDTKWVSDQRNVRRVLKVYLSKEKPTSQETALLVGTTYHNVRHVLVTSLTPEEYRGEKRLRCSRSKLGKNNPMLGKYGELHHRYKGEVFTKDGYLQVKRNGRYVLVHRQVMADLLGLSSLPRSLEVHHIDGVKTNNDPDNLALVTPGGHQQLHADSSLLSRSPLWVQHQYSTSLST